MVAASSEHRAGDLVADKYLLVRVLEIGGMGAVWVAHHITLDIHVALKFILPDLDSPTAAARLVLEAQTAARVRHPAIVHVLDVGRTADGETYLAMELLEGELLADVLGRERRLDPDTAIRVLLPIAEALDALHRSGSVHRDVKPENVFLAHNDAGRWQPKLIDFGLARRMARDVGRITQQGAIVGTPVYMSRERLLGEDVDTREDVYSLSVVLYQALTGVLPFDGETPMALVTAMTANRPQPTVGFGVGDADLWAIVRRGLAPPDERWASAWELGKALAGWLWRHGGTDDITGVSLRPVWIGDDDVRLLTDPLASRVPTARFEVPAPRQEIELAPSDAEPCEPNSGPEELDAYRAAAPTAEPRRGRGLTVLAASMAAIAIVSWSTLILRDTHPESAPAEVAPAAAAAAMGAPLVCEPGCATVPASQEAPASAAPSTSETEPSLPSRDPQADVAPPHPPAARAPVVRAVVRAPVVRAPVVRAPVVRAPVVRAPIARAPVMSAPPTRVAPVRTASHGSNGADADDGPLPLKNPYE